MPFDNLKKKFLAQNESVDEPITPLGGYNNIEPPTPPEMNLQPIESDPNVPSMPDGEDGRPGKNLDFSSIIRALGQRIQNNLQSSDKLIGDASAQTMDKLKMQANPKMYGPPQPEGASPEQLALSNAVGQGIAGSIGPRPKVSSAPWMQRLTQEEAENAISKVPGLIKNPNELTQRALETQVKNRAAFQALKRKLGG